MTSRTTLALAPSTDGGHDLYLDANGQIAFVHDAEAVGQHARCRLMTHRGEWFLDTTAGTPWLDRILGKRADLTLAESVIKAAIKGTDGVSEITSFDLRYRAATRGLDLVSATVKTIFGEEVSV